MTVLAQRAEKSEAQVQFWLNGRVHRLGDLQVVARAPGDKLIEPAHYLVLGRLGGQWVELMVFPSTGWAEATAWSDSMAQWLIRHYEGLALVEQARAQARKKGVA